MSRYQVVESAGVTPSMTLEGVEAIRVVEVVVVVVVQILLLCREVGS